MAKRIGVLFTLIVFVLAMPIAMSATKRTTHPQSTVEIHEKFFGAEARAYINKKSASNPKFKQKLAERRARMIALGYKPLDDQVIVVRHRVQKAKPAPATMMEALVQFFEPSVKADCLISYPSGSEAEGQGWKITPAEDCDDGGGGGESDFFPYDSGSDNDILYDGYDEVDTSDNVIGLWAYADFDSDDASNTWNDWDQEITDTVLNQNDFWDGIACWDQADLISTIKKDAFEDAIVALGGAAIPCIGFGPGWFACVGGTFGMTYVTAVEVKMVDMQNACQA